LKDLRSTWQEGEFDAERRVLVAQTQCRNE
jgi:hypothetical protein